MSCIVSRLLTDVTPPRLRELPRTGRRGQGSGAGCGRPRLVLLRVPPGLTSESIAPCTCIRMVFRTFKRIRSCIRVHLGNFVPDSDIAAGCHIVAIRRQLGSPLLPTRQAVYMSIKSHQRSLWITTVHLSVIFVTYATINTRIYTTKDARTGCPVGMTGTTKNARGGHPPRAVTGRVPAPRLARGRPRPAAWRRGRCAPR